MKITITFTSALLNNFENLIFKTAIQDDWQKKWELLLDKEGNPFDDIDEAINFIRTETENDWGIGLSTFKQAKMENAQWDNL